MLDDIFADSDSHRDLEVANLTANSRQNVAQFDCTLAAIESPLLQPSRDQGFESKNSQSLTSTGEGRKVRVLRLL